MLSEQASSTAKVYHRCIALAEIIKQVAGHFQAPLTANPYKLLSAKTILGLATSTKASLHTTASTSPARSWLVGDKQYCPT